MREKSTGRFGKALRLGVAHDALALVETRRWGREADLIAECALDAAVAFPAALAAGLNTLFDGAALARLPLTVVLADDLARLWQVTPPAQCTRMVDLEAAAAQRFQQLFGEAAAGWSFSADWQPARPFLAAALPHTVLGALQQCAGARALPLIEVAPQFVALCNRWHGNLAAGDWFGVAHDGVLTVGACTGHAAALSSMRAVAIDGHADGAWLRAHLAREALRLNIAPPVRLRLAGSVPPAWSALPDCVVLGVQPASWSPAALLALSGAAA